MVRLINTLVHDQFCSETLLNRQFDMLYLNAGFALVVRTINTARCNFHFDMCKQRSNTLFRFKNTLVQFCGEHAGSGELTDDTRRISIFSSRIKALPHGSVLSQLLIMVCLWYTILTIAHASICINQVTFHTPWIY